MKTLNIFAKLFLTHTIVGLFAIFSLSSIVYVLLGDILIQRTLDQLSSINILKKELVESYFFMSQQNLQALQLEKKFLNIHTDLTNPGGFDHHDIDDIASICKLYDFENLHLFDADHRQLYSTDSTMYPEGIVHHIDTTVAQHPDRLWIIDASPVSDDKHTLLFYYVPILKDSNRVGMVLVQENFEKIQRILLENTSMGSTGESYIVGNDYFMRSQSRFIASTELGKLKVQTPAIREAFQQRMSRGIVTDYRGQRALNVSRQLGNNDLGWIIISEVDLNEARAPIVQFRNYLLGLTLFVMAMILFITFFISNAIARPIRKLRETIVTLSKGMIPSGDHRITSNDEIGQMAHAVYQLTEGFERTTAFANQIGEGNFNTTFTTLSEHDRLGYALLHMRDELRTLNERELRSARERASALLEGQENERRRIIKELHDGVGQLLTAIRMQVDRLEENGVWKHEIKERINETITEVKRISYNVMPQALVDFGLEAALKGLCDNVKKYATFTVDFRYIKEYDHNLSFEVNIALFRIVQEGLNNIVKHAEAMHVNLHVLDNEHEIYLILEDDGRGFDDTAPGFAPGQGLRNIRERAKLLNGYAEIGSQPGKGTTVEVHIPVA